MEIVSAAAADGMNIHHIALAGVMEFSFEDHLIWIILLWIVNVIQDQFHVLVVQINRFKENKIDIN